MEDLQESELLNDTEPITQDINLVIPPTFDMTTVSSRSSTSTSPINITPSAPTPSPTPSCSSTSLATSCQTSKKRKASDIDELLNVARRNIEALKSSDPDVDFGRVVANELKQMAYVQKKIAKKLVFDTLHLGSMDLLTTNHQIIRTLDINE